jgi:hypothetical protein
VPPADETTDKPDTGGGSGPWNWDRTVNLVLGGGPNGPIDRGDLTGISWIEHDVTWRDQAVEKGVIKDREPWKYNTELNVLHFYRWIATRNGANDIDNIIVRVRVNRDEYLPKWQDWSHGSYLSVLPFLDQRNHPVLDRQSMVNAANSFHLVEQWLDSTADMVKRQMDSIDTEASGFSGSAAAVFHNNLFNLHRDMEDLHRDMSDKRLQGPRAWSNMLLGGADAVGEFGRDMRNIWYDKPNWIGPDGIIYGNWLSLPAQQGPTLTEHTSERSIYQSVLNSLGGNWETQSVDDTQFGLANWNVEVNLSLNAGGDPELIRTVDILTAEGWRIIDQLAKLRWIKGVQMDLDRVAEVVVPKLETRLDTIALRSLTGVEDRPLGGDPNDPTSDISGTPPPLQIPDITSGGPPPEVSPFTGGASPPPGPGGGGGGNIGGVSGPGLDVPGIIGSGGGGSGIVGPGGGSGAISPGFSGPGLDVPGITGPGSGGGLIGGLPGRDDPISGGGGVGGLPNPVVGAPPIVRPGSWTGPLAGGGGGAPGSSIGRPGASAAIGGGGGSLGGPSAVNEQIGGLTATPFGGGLIGAAPDGVGSYQDLAKLSADAAGREVTGKSADGTAGMGGYPFMPPMGGMGAPNSAKEQDRERKTWLTEDEEVWGTDPGVVAAVIGRDPLPDADTPVRTAEPGSSRTPARTETTRTARGRA